jgi:hypothetical protein
MDKRKSFTGGEPDVRLNQILIDAEANRPAMFGMMEAFERFGNFTISGCVVTVGGTAPNNTWDLSAGYIYLNQEVVQVDTQAGIFDADTQFLAFTKQTTFNPLGDKTFIDGTPRQTWEVNRGLINVQGSVSASELDAINGDRLKDAIDFKKDIISAVQTSTTVDFSTDEDLIRVDISSIPVDVISINISNIVNGDDTKYLEITTTIGKSVIFPGATDVSSVENNIAIGETVVYQIWNKNGSLFVKSIRNLIGDWQTPSYNANFSAGVMPFEYRLNHGKLEFRGDINSSAGGNLSAFTLPAAYRPAYDTAGVMTIVSATATPISFEVKADGQVRAYDWAASGDNTFNNVFIIE